MSAPFGKTGLATFLAPMQDITDADFMEIIARRGPPDFYVAEYFRIHEFFEFELRVLRAVLSRPGGRPVCAQFIGGDEAHILRALRELSKYPQITSLDLNLGCPAPKIYRKNVGGGLLRSPEKIRALARAIRENWGGVFSVKMRLGFDSSDAFEGLFSAVLDGGPDFVTVHARTVKQLYRGACDYSKIALAVKMSPVPVVANGDIWSAHKALEVARQTKCAGVMVGRHAVRNPWIFRQISEAARSETPYSPTLGEVRGYVGDILRSVLASSARYPDSRMKKYLNFIGASVDPDGAFLREMRISRGVPELMRVCDKYMLGGRARLPFPQEPYAGVCPRPNHEDRCQETKK